MLKQTTVKGRSRHEKAFAKAISELAENKELREEISKKNLEKIKGYDVTVVEKEIKAIYEEVLSK